MVPADPSCRMLDFLSTAVMLVDRDLRVLSINPAGERLLDVSVRKAVGSIVSGIVPRSGEFNAALSRMVASGIPCTERNVPLEPASDRSVVTDIIVTPLNDEGAHEWVVEMLDVDSRARIQHEHNIAMQHHVTCSWSRGLAHEIKNPLGGVRGAAQLLERRLSDPNLREHTRIIIEEADRLSKLVDRMLQPAILPNKSVVNLHEVLERVVGIVSADLPRGVHLERDYDPSLPPIFGDPDQLIQAVMNIVLNGIQAVGDSGNITIRTRSDRHVTIGRTRHRLTVRIDIVDDGPGIDDEFRDQIFYPMISGRAGGTGLGLAIAQSVVHHHDGMIEFSSQPGETVFSIHIPIEKNPS